MTSEEARRIAGAWVDAWNSGEADRVLAMLHPDAVVADPIDGKVRKGDVAAFVRSRLASVPVPVHSFVSLAGSDSVALVCTLADGGRTSDTLVLADDGTIVRVMRHV